MENYSLVLLDKHGTILTWNRGVEKLKGYKATEIIGQHISIFYLPQDRQNGLADKLLKEAAAKGTATYVGRRIRKNGTIFWGKVDVAVVNDENGKVIGFTKMARELSEETAINHFWFDNDGVLHTKARAVEHSPAAIEEYRAIINSALNGQKVCVISDVRDAVLSESGIKHSSSGIDKIYKAIAFVSGDQNNSNTQSLLELVPEEIPAKVFSTRDEAKTWISQFLS